MVVEKKFQVLSFEEIILLPPHGHMVEGKEGRTFSTVKCFIIGRNLTIFVWL